MNNKPIDAVLVFLVLPFFWPIYLFAFLKVIEFILFCIQNCIQNRVQKRKNECAQLKDKIKKENIL